MKKPFILTPASFNIDQPPEKFHFNKAYMSAIERAGGLPFGIMRPNEEDLDVLLENTDGIFLMGGNDIEPATYNEANEHSILCEPERDAIELLLIKKSIERNIPLLAICRGFQMLNIAMGGTLYQDVLEQMPGAIQHSFHRDKEDKPLPRDLTPHNVSINKETLLYSLSGLEQTPVNSLHHQGIKELGAGLRVSATAPDGLIEAIEIANHPFALGVQWHPEELHDEVSQKIFSTFIKATKNRS